MFKPSNLLFSIAFTIANFSTNALAAPVQPTTPVNIDHIVVFGDSLSDDGNLHATMAKLGVDMPAYPYWQGRFSSGPTWAEDLAGELTFTNRKGSSLFHPSDDQFKNTASFTDYAVGGAWADLGDLERSEDRC